MSLLTHDDFLGWEKYPHNLGLSPLEADAYRCDERLTQNRERLFVGRDGCRVGVLEFGRVRKGVI
jgi:hypothetical protein